MRDALIEHGGYVVDLFGLFNERDRDDLGRGLARVSAKRR